MSGHAPQSTGGTAPPVWRPTPVAPGWYAFRSLAGLSAWVRGLLFFNAVIGLLLAALAVLPLAFPARPVGPDELTHWEWSEACVGLFSILGLVTCGVLFIVFLFRARANVRALDGQELRQASAWVIAGWVVPVIWLWKPYQVVLELWERSACDSRGQAVPAASAAPLNLWWAVWLVSNGVSAFSFRMEMRGEWHADSPIASVLGLVSALTWSWAAVVAARIVRDLTTSQEMRFACLAAEEGQCFDGDPVTETLD